MSKIRQIECRENDDPIQSLSNSLISEPKPEETMSNIFKETRIPHQKHYNSVPFPTVLCPSLPSCSVAVLIDSIKTHKPFLESLLFNAGAILFRGFPINTATDFNDFVEAFGFEELAYSGGGAPRTQIVGRVYTANEAPSDQNIPFHHEMNRLPVFPSKVFFFCEVEPKTGGETPIVLSHVVYNEITDRYPDFVQRVEDPGLVYTRILGEESDLSSPIGRGWKSAYSTQDKAVAEERAAKLMTKLEWLEQGVKAITGPLPGIGYDESREHKIWFNSLGMAASRTNRGKDPAMEITLGDGEPLPVDILDDCLKIIEEESVAIPWQKGDVLLVDNLAVMHARRSCNGPRRVLASLCK